MNDKEDFSIKSYRLDLFAWLFTIAATIFTILYTGDSIALYALAFPLTLSCTHLGVDGYLRCNDENYYN